MEEIADYAEKAIASLPPAKGISVYTDVITQCLRVCPENESLRQSELSLLKILLGSLLSDDRDLKVQSMKDLHTISCHLSPISDKIGAKGSPSLAHFTAQLNYISIFRRHSTS